MGDIATGTATITANAAIQTALALAADTCPPELRPSKSHGSVVADVLTAVGFEIDGPYHGDGDTVAWHAWYDSTWHRDVEGALNWLSSHGAGIEAKFRGGESGGAWTYDCPVGSGSIEGTYLVELPHTELASLRADAAALAALRAAVAAAPDGASWSAADILALTAQPAP